MIWDSPFGPLRFDYAYRRSRKDPYDRDPAVPVRRRHEILIAARVACASTGSDGMTEPSFYLRAAEA